jgi:hypothetical protein
MKKETPEFSDVALISLLVLAHRTGRSPSDPQLQSDAAKLAEQVIDHYQIKEINNV